MTSMPVYQISYLRQLDDLRDEAHVLAWLEALAAEGYYITSIDDPFEERYEEVLQTNTLSPGLSPLAQTAAHDFCAGDDEELACSAYALTEDFTVVLTLFEPEGSVCLSADDSHFTAGEIHQQKYQMFLTLVEVSYQQWHPIYGFDHAGADEGNTPSRNEALALQVSSLFTINLFGPEYAAKLGRERLLSAPAWQVRELDDGGVLVVPVPYVKEDWRQPSPYSQRAVAQHLGIPSE
jgi:hypothetical protein